MLRTRFIIIVHFKRQGIVTILIVSCEKDFIDLFSTMWHDHLVSLCQILKTEIFSFKKPEAKLYSNL